VVRAVFYGLGSDGTVGANKNSIKIIGEETDNYAQGYFVYDSKKSGSRPSRTCASARADPQHLSDQRATSSPCHQFGFLERYDVLGLAEEGAVLLLNAPTPPTRCGHLPAAGGAGADHRQAHQALRHRRLRRWPNNGMGGRINTIMQTCFFAIRRAAARRGHRPKIKESIKKTYGKRGEAVVQKNYAAVDDTLANLFEVPVPAR
jgi:pyruvate-ferredoxin/flavodoxin oxidoreductase